MAVSAEVSLTNSLLLWQLDQAQLFEQLVPLGSALPEGPSDYSGLALL